MSRKPETAIQTRFADELFDRIEKWRRTQHRIPPLATSIRILVECGLAAAESAGDQPQRRRKMKSELERGTAT